MAVSPARVRGDDAGPAAAAVAAGLTTAAARRLLEEYGRNAIEQARGPGVGRRLVEQFVHLFALLLWVGAALALVAGMPQFAIAIVAVIVLNGVFGLVQEWRAENAVAALRQLLPVEATVRRDGQTGRIPAEELVPGDVLLLTEGDRVSADARLVEATDLSLDESNLTGESRPIAKSPGGLVFAGSMVDTGEGTATVVATGMRTEFGRVAHLTQSLAEGESPLQREVMRVARRVALLSVAMGAVFFAVGHLVAGLSFQAGAIFAIGIVLGNVPEGLLPTMTLSLAMGVRRMAKRNAIVKRLSAVETLGSCTVICTDKTGTLTANQMTVRRVWLPGQLISISGEGYRPEGELLAGAAAAPAAAVEQARALLEIGALCSSARLREAESGWAVVGDPTEAAVLVAAVKAGADLAALDSRLPLERRFAFDPVRKRTSAIRRTERGHLVAAKGATDQLVDLCCSVEVGGRLLPMDPEQRRAALAANERLANQGLRVLGVARRALHPGAEITALSAAAVERDLVFLGLVAMEDPPRAEVPAAIQKCRAAGIRVVMTTGDYRGTAEAIAREIGMVDGGSVLIIDGHQLAALSEAELRLSLQEPNLIFSRLTPEQKLRIVGALQSLGEVVAVTGDGVNDAPALKKADIGVAMGLSGTDVAREAADMVLTDDNFATIVAAIEEGRAIFDNMRKFIVYIFAHLSPEAVPYVLFALFRIPLPLTVMQILAIDLGTETVPALALGSERPEPDVMTRRPRRRDEALLDWGSLARGYGFLGLLTTTVVMLGFFWLLHLDGWTWGQHRAVAAAVGAQATTVVFLGIVLMQVGNAFACRTERVSAFRIGVLSNQLLLWGILFELVLAALLIYTPGLRDVFGMAPLGIYWWLGIAAFVPLIFLAEELRKRVARLRAQTQPSRTGSRRRIAPGSSTSA